MKPKLIDWPAECPEGRCQVIGYYWSHSMGSRLHPDQFNPILRYICERVEYGPEGETKGLVAKAFDEDKVVFL